MEKRLIMTATINKPSVLPPIVDFTIAKTDDTSFANYTLNISTPQGTTNQKTFNLDNSRSSAYFIPDGSIVKLTPKFTIPNHNGIVQYKWTFGDGIESLINVDPSVTNPADSVYHKYTFTPLSSIANVSSKNLCVPVLLTAVDYYQRVIHCQKIIYPQGT
jgi:hypothetical protein